MRISDKFRKFAAEYCIEMASSKEKNKRFKNAQRRKRRKERGKLALKSAVSIDCEKKKKYKFEEYLVNCDDVIAQMVPAKGRLYRLAHTPNIEIDFYPTSLWNYESLTPKEEEIPQTIPPGSSIDIQRDQVGDYLPSFNITAEGAASIFIDRFKSKSEEGRKGFVLTKGDAIYAYDIEDAGRMLVEDNGHILLQTYEDFNLADHISEEEPPILLIDYIKP